MDVKFVITRVGGEGGGGGEGVEYAEAYRVTETRGMPFDGSNVFK